MSELERARQWSVALATTLDDVVDELGAAARRLADAWPDGRGREWTEHLLLLRRTLADDADGARDLGRAVDLLAADGSETYGSDLGAVGPRLGGTSARRAHDDRGVTIPQLGDDPDG